MVRKQGSVCVGSFLMLCISCYYEKEIYFWNGMKKRCSFCVRIQTYIIISLQKKYNQNYNNATYHYYSHKRNCWSYQMSWLDYKLHYILMLPIFDETNSAFNCLSCVKFTPWYMFFNAENVKIIFFRRLDCAAPTSCSKYTTSMHTA